MLVTRKTLVINKLIDTKHKFIHIDPSVYLCVCVCVSLSVCLSVCLSLLVEVHVKSYSLFSFDERLADDKLQSFRHLGGRKLDATFREVPKLSVNELLLKHLTTISNLGFDGVDRLGLLPLEFSQSVVNVLIALPNAAEILKLVADLQLFCRLLPLTSLLFRALTHQIFPTFRCDLLLSLLYQGIGFHG